MDNIGKCPASPAAGGLARRLGGFGGLAVLVFLFQAVSGIYMAMFFQPTPAEAWASIEFIESRVSLGAFFRALHRWGAFLLTLFLIFHFLGVLFRGAWRRGKRNWFTGLLLLLLSAAFIVTGYLLPWDFRSYWTVKTIGHWLERLPLFADALRWLLFADTQNGLVPVSRWFALHTLVLPLLAGLCFSGHFLRPRSFSPGRSAQSDRSSDGH